MSYAELKEAQNNVALEILKLSNAYGAIKFSKGKEFESERAELQSSIHHKTLIFEELGRQKMREYLSEKVEDPEVKQYAIGEGSPQYGITHLHNIRRIKELMRRAFGRSATEEAEA